MKNPVFEVSLWRMDEGGFAVTLFNFGFEELTVTYHTELEAKRALRNTQKAIQTNAHEVYGFGPFLESCRSRGANE